MGAGWLPEHKFRRSKEGGGGGRAIGITQEEVVDPVDLRVRQQPPSNSRGLSKSTFTSSYRIAKTSRMDEGKREREGESRVTASD